MRKRPRKNVGPTAIFNSEIHHDVGMETRHVTAGTRSKNMETNPLSLFVAVRAIWYTTRPAAAARTVPSNKRVMAGQSAAFV